MDSDRQLSTHKSHWNLFYEWRHIRVKRPVDFSELTGINDWYQTVKSFYQLSDCPQSQKRSANALDKGINPNVIKLRNNRLIYFALL